MKKRLHPKSITGSKRLEINNQIYEFIRRIARDGARDILGPKATKDAVERETRRRFSL